MEYYAATKDDVYHEIWGNAHNINYIYRYYLVSVKPKIYILRKKKPIGNEPWFE